MKTVHVEVTQEIIDQHGADLGDCENCPGYHALRAAGIEVADCGVSYFYIEDEDGEVRFPDEFRQWQMDGFDAWRDLGIHPGDGIGSISTDAQRAAVLKPISFDVQIPEEAAP